MIKPLQGTLHLTLVIVQTFVWPRSKEYPAETGCYCGSYGNLLKQKCDVKYAEFKAVCVLRFGKLRRSN